MSIVDIIGNGPQLFTFAEKIGTIDLGVISADVTMSEEYAFENEITTNPVERGIDVVDHKRRKPDMIRMSGIITDSPNDVLDVVEGNTNGIPGTVSVKRSQDGYKALRELARKTDPITIITHIDVFENMTIQSLSIKKNDAGEMIGFDCTMIEMRFADTQFGIIVEKSVAHTAPKKPKAHVTPAPLEDGSVLRKLAPVIGLK